MAKAVAHVSVYLDIVEQDAKLAHRVRQIHARMAETVSRQDTDTDAIVHQAILVSIVNQVRSKSFQLRFIFPLINFVNFTTFNKNINH